MQYMSAALITSHLLPNPRTAFDFPPAFTLLCTGAGVWVLQCSVTQLVQLIIIINTWSTHRHGTNQ